MGEHIDEARRDGLTLDVYLGPAGQRTVRTYVGNPVGLDGDVAPIRGLARTVVDGAVAQYEVVGRRILGGGHPRCQREDKTSEGKSANAVIMNHE
jgi:hypothetical protein